MSTKATTNKPMLPPSATAFLTQLLTQRHLSPLTQRRYAHALGLMHAINQDLNQISAAQLQRCISQQHLAGLVPASLAVMVSAWRSYCKWSSLQGLLKADPSADLLLPKKSKPLPKALAIDAMGGFLKPAVTGAHAQKTEAPLHEAIVSRDQAVLELLYGCGLRAAELLGLDIQRTPHSLGWLDLPAQQVHVLGKGNKRRCVPLPSMASSALSAWLALRHQMLKPAAFEGEGVPGEQASQEINIEAALFLGKRGARLEGTALRKITQARAVAAQLGQGVHPHMLRHSYASHMLQTSGDLRAVQELLGHASIAATQVYARLDFQHLATVYDKAHPRAGLAKSSQNKPNK